MATPKKEYRILVAGSEKLFGAVSALLPDDEFTVASGGDSAAALRARLQMQGADLVLIGTPLQGEPGTALALELAQDNIGVLLIVPEDAYRAVCEQVSDSGVLTLPRPVGRENLLRSIHLLRAMRSKLLQMEQKQERLQEKMRDIHLVSRAKWLLIEKMHFSEQDAHYFIEKKAMDSRLSRAQVARDIIKAYE